MHEDCTPTHGYAAPREAAMAAFAKKLAVGISGAGQAEQATRQRWPPPAPRLRRLLRCHPAGWQSGRGGLSTGATVGSPPPRLQAMQSGHRKQRQTFLRIEGMSLINTELPIPNVRSSVANWVKRTRYAQCEFFAF